MEFFYQYNRCVQELSLLVKDISGRLKWSVSYPSYTTNEQNGDLICDPTLIELGVLQNADDCQGLESYLKSTNVLLPEDTLSMKVSEEEFKEGGSVKVDEKHKLRHETYHIKGENGFIRASIFHDVTPGQFAVDMSRHIKNDDGTHNIRIKPRVFFSNDKKESYLEDLKARGGEKASGEEFAEGGIAAGSPFQYGDNVEFIKNAPELNDQYVSPAKKWKIGDKGRIRNIKKTPEGEFLYNIDPFMGMVGFVDVPASDLKAYNQELQEKVEKRLDEKQKTKDFKDVGKRVAGSKKERAAYAMISFSDLEALEKDEITASQMVVKDKVYPEINVLEEKAAGVSSGAVFLKLKIREACGTKPPNNALKRASFIKFINLVVERTTPLKTVKQLQAYLSSLKELTAEEVMGYFIDPSFFELSEEDKEKARAGFKEKFPFSSMYSITNKLLEEVFGKRFSNFMYMSSDAATTILGQAIAYEGISAEQEIENIKAYKEKKQKFIDANQAIRDSYQTMSEQELRGKFSNWSGMDRYRKDMPGFRTAVLDYYQLRIDRGIKELEAVPENIKQREDDWSWFEKGKDRKEAEKSGEIQINVGLPLSYIKRTGGLVIKEEYVEAAQNTDADKNPITNDFGFKSAQFGQSLRSVQAREHIRHFLGAMADIAEILDLDIHQLNGIGGLSIAFAARGSGRAAAHYERGRCIINITNNNGDGALAHEFGHYLDNAITMWGKNALSMNYGSEIKKVRNRFGQEKVESFITNEKVSSAMLGIMNFFSYGKQGVTPKVGVVYQAKEGKIPRFYDEKERTFTSLELKGTIEETFEYLASRTQMLRTMEYRYPDQQTALIGFVIHSFGLTDYEVLFTPSQSAYLYYATLMQSPYWIKPWELFARAWECYIADKLTKAGRANNYLVSGTYFNTKINLKDGGYTYVYPFGQERDYLFELYENLINAVRTEFSVSGFKPFTTERQDEYIVLEEKSKTEEVKSEVTVPVVEEPTATTPTVESIRGRYLWTKTLNEIKDDFKKSNSTWLGYRGIDSDGNPYMIDVDRDYIEASFKQSVEGAVKDGSYEKAIQDGTLTKTEVEEIINSQKEEISKTTPLSTSEQNMLNSAIEKVNIDPESTVQLAELIARHGQEPRAIYHLAEAINYEGEKNDAGYGRISFADLIGFLINGRLYIGRVERMEELGILPAEGKKDMELMHEFKDLYQKLNLPDNAKKLIKTFADKILDEDNLKVEKVDLSGTTVFRFAINKLSFVLKTIQKETNKNSKSADFLVATAEALSIVAKEIENKPEELALSATQKVQELFIKQQTNNEDKVRTALQFYYPGQEVFKKLGVPDIQDMNGHEARVKWEFILEDTKYTIDIRQSRDSFHVYSGSYYKDMSNIDGWHQFDSHFAESAAGIDAEVLKNYEAIENYVEYFKGLKKEFEEEKPPPVVRENGLSDRAQAILDASMQSYEEATPKQKEKYKKQVEDNLKLNQKGEDLIGFDLDQDMVAAGRAFLKLVEEKENKQTFTSKDLPKTGETIYIHAPALGDFPEKDLELKYDKDNFIFSIFENGKKVGKMGEREVLDNLNNGLYVITAKKEVPVNLSFNEFVKSKGHEHWYKSNRPIKRYEEINYKRFSDKEYEQLEAEHKKLYPNDPSNVVQRKYDEDIEKNKEENQASILGREAFRKGIKAIPIHDPELRKLLEGKQIGEGTPILEAWSKAWHKENLKSNREEDEKIEEPHETAAAHTKPTEERSEKAIAQDKKLKAKKPGWRKSPEGKWYFEDRPNRSDVDLRKKFAEGGLLFSPEPGEDMEEEDFEIDKKSLKRMTLMDTIHDLNIDMDALRLDMEEISDTDSDEYKMKQQDLKDMEEDLAVLTAEFKELDDFDEEAEKEKLRGKYASGGMVTQEVKDLILENLKQQTGHDIKPPLLITKVFSILYVEYYDTTTKEFMRCKSDMTGKYVTGIKVNDKFKFSEGGLINSSFHVRHTLIDKEYFNSLPEKKREEIAKLVKEFNSLGYIDATTQLGPDQARRMSDKQREHLTSTATKAFAIEQKIKELLKPDSQVSREQSEAETRKLKERKGQLERQISDLKHIFPHKINSPRSNGHKLAYTKAKEELEQIDETLSKEEDPGLKKKTN